MAGSSETRQETLVEAGSAQPEPIVDLAIDVDNDVDDNDGESGGVDAGDGKVLFAKSTDIRRRIEERLEVKLLRDQLGMDDLDL